MDKANEVLLGRDLFGEIVKPNIKGILKERFLIPPFSVLSARDGDWQTRKRQWLSLGIQSELGRGEAVTWGISPSGRGTGEYSNKAYTDNSKKGLTFKGNVASFDYYRVKEGKRETTDTQGTSIFDPVLCELMYSWFCPEGGQIIDPFCGGSVRGMVASVMGYNYWGCDLSQRQIDANYAQINLCSGNKPIWIYGDALDKLKDAPQSDFIFTCPPYGNLEVYSDDPRDISTMDYRTFIKTLADIIKLVVIKLKDNRFACIVVGDFRDKKGFYNNFVSHTIWCFKQAGCKLYNEIILVTAVGSLPIRITKQFESSRKIGKTHQNVLVFCKGNPPRF